MVNVYEAVNRIRMRLLSDGIDPINAEAMVAFVSTELEFAINAAAEDALNEARQLGSGIGAEEFLRDVRVIHEHDGIRIGTTTGQTDYLTQPFPMLPHLLKNAKVSSKTGMRYKHIPLAKAAPGSGVPNMFEGQAAQNAAIRHKQASARTKNNDVTIRTATDQQNPNTQWVIPSKSVDVGSLLDHVNKQLEQNVKMAVDNIIARYLNR